jgi:hypothetical protein
MQISAAQFFEKFTGRNRQGGDIPFGKWVFLHMFGPFESNKNS